MRARSLRSATASRILRLVAGGAFAAMLSASAGCDKEVKFTGVEPAFGAFTGGEEIILRGNALPRVGMQVRFGLKEAQPVVVESDSKVKVLTPPGDKSTKVDISITFDDGRHFVMKQAFTYVDNQQKQTMDKTFSKFPGETK